MTASLDAGNAFLGWSGVASGSANPLLVMLDRTRTITAAFGVPLSPAVEGEGFTSSG